MIDVHRAAAARTAATIRRLLHITQLDEALYIADEAGDRRRTRPLCSVPTEQVAR